MTFRTDNYPIFAVLLLTATRYINNKTINLRDYSKFNPNNYNNDLLIHAHETNYCEMMTTDKKFDTFID